MALIQVFYIYVNMNICHVIWGIYVNTILSRNYVSFESTIHPVKYSVKLMFLSKQDELIVVKIVEDCNM